MPHKAHSAHSACHTNNAENYIDIAPSHHIHLPIRSRFGPTSIEFQLNDTFEGQSVKPSQCLVVTTIYLELVYYFMSANKIGYININVF